MPGFRPCKNPHLDAYAIELGARRIVCAEVDQKLGRVLSTPRGEKTSDEQQRVEQWSAKHETCLSQTLFVIHRYRGGSPGTFNALGVLAAGAQGAASAATW